MNECPPPAQKAGSGFSAIELLVVMAVAGILAGLAGPALGRIAAGQAAASQADEFMTALRYARSEARRRGEVVTVCARAGQSCAEAGAADWRSGWWIFVDRGARGVLDAGDQVLRTRQPLALSGGVAGTRAALSFVASGITLNAASHFEFRWGGSGAMSLLVCVSKQGRARLAAAGATACD